MFFFFKQKTAYEMRISYWSSDVCSSDLIVVYRLFLHPMVRFGGNASKRCLKARSRLSKFVPRGEHRQPSAAGDSPVPAPDKIIRLQTVRDRTGLSRSTIYRKIAEGTFPRQIKISVQGAEIGRATV